MRGNKCKFRHTQGQSPKMTKKPPCRDFNMGNCRWGVECKYEHKRQGMGHRGGRPEHREGMDPKWGHNRRSVLKQGDKEECWYFKENRKCPFNERGCRFACYRNQGRMRVRQDKYEEALQHISFLEERIRSIRRTNCPTENMATSYPVHTQIPRSHQAETHLPQKWGQINPWEAQGMHSTRTL